MMQQKLIYNGNAVNNNYKNIIYTIINKYDLYDYRVAVVLDREPILLFVLQIFIDLGITYIPIDPTYPFERIQYMIKDSQANIVITQKRYKDLLKNINIINIDEINPKNITLVPPHVHNEIAYILYTSGTTGNPKGVEVTRSGLFNFIDGVSEVIDFSPNKRIACLTTVSFDIFMLESIMAFYKGLTVVLANTKEQQNPKLMVKFIKENEIEMIQMTPSRMQILLTHDRELYCLKKVKEIMIGGEPFPPILLKTLQSKTKAKIYNMYGPIETTIWSTISDLTNKEKIDIGKPIKNTQIYIIDENLNILKDGQDGEICIAGKGVAKGYLNNEQLTSEKFIYLNGIQERVYRTGDFGRLISNGILEFSGRIDNQVKIFGHRIELEEIESIINEFEGILQAVVIAKENEDILSKILIAFYTSDKIIDHNELKNFISARLPSYMVPLKYVKVKEFEYTNNKISRKNF